MRYNALGPAPQQPEPVMRDLLAALKQLWLNGVAAGWA
ncbi:hypothetical protein PCAR4_1210042 [Paraburkholderia caribensis]|nr:hypothetical protein PCAR4_1210042 [Paraburkholderia caribensis]